MTALSSDAYTVGRGACGRRGCSRLLACVALATAGFQVGDEQLRRLQSLDGLAGRRLYMLSSRPELFSPGMSLRSHEGASLVMGITDIDCRCTKVIVRLSVASLSAPSADSKRIL